MELQEQIGLFLRECRILLVDDNKSNLDLLIGALKDDYKLGVAKNGQTALAQAQTGRFDLILLDVMMPEMNGYEVCRRLKLDPLTADIPVIFLTALNEIEEKTRGFDSGAADYITKPFETAEVKARVKNQLYFLFARRSLQNQNEILEMMVNQRTRELEQAQREIVARLGFAAEYRDIETAGHLRRMSEYSYLLSCRLGLSSAETEMIRLAAPLHDVGKIGIPDKILLKPGPLDPNERETMKKHTLIGAKMLDGSETKLLETSREIALTHHEKWDGTGYPLGLKGEEIPFSGRIIGICDVFDALTSKRPYKEPWPVEQAVELIAKERGLHFDPTLVDLFFEHLDEILMLKAGLEKDRVTHPDEFDFSGI